MAADRVAPGHQHVRADSAMHEEVVHDSEEVECDAAAELHASNTRDSVAPTVDMVGLQEANSDLHGVRHSHREDSIQQENDSRDTVGSWHRGVAFAAANVLVMFSDVLLRTENVVNALPMHNCPGCGHGWIHRALGFLSR